MEIEKEVENIDDAFDLYRLLISDPQLCTSNQRLLSGLSYQIDALALAEIINFFNNYPDFFENGNFWKPNLFVIRTFATFSCEIIKCSQENNHIDIQYCTILRNNLHYENQTSFSLGDSQTLYHELERCLSTVELLYSRILKTLSISPSKLRFLVYRFLRWVQIPNG